MPGAIDSKDCEDDATMMPLSGTRILSFTHFLQGTSATQMLADLGADVIKIERPTGAYERSWSGIGSYVDGVSVFFMLAGRNQRNLSVDLRSPEGREIVWKLVEEADAIIENYRPGVLDRLGFGYEEISEARPDIVYCSLSGFGSSGPYRNEVGQDLLAQAISGMAMLTGRKDDPPTPTGTAIVDQHAAVLGAFGVLAALYKRKISGEGTHVDSNLLNAALDLQIEPFNYHINGFDLYERTATNSATRFHEVPYGIFETADGYICISTTPVGKMTQCLGDKELEGWTREDQFEKRDELNRKIASHVRQKTTQQWSETFAEFGIWHAPVNSYEEIEKHPQVEYSGAIMTLDHPRAGKVRLLSHPVRYNGEAPPVRIQPPALGEHNREILRGLGYDYQAIENLESEGVLGGSAEQGVVTKKDD